MIKIKENAFSLKTPFFGGAYAFVLGETIRYKKEVKDYSPSVFWHELCHVCQYKEHGILKFLFIYFITDFFKSYREKRFEKEAYTVKTKADLLKLYPQYISLINESEKIFNKYVN